MQGKLGVFRSVGGEHRVARRDSLGSRGVTEPPRLHSGPPRVRVLHRTWLLPSQEPLPGPGLRPLPRLSPPMSSTPYCGQWGLRGRLPRVGMCRVTQKVPWPHLTETVCQEVSGWKDHEDCFLCGDEPFRTPAEGRTVPMMCAPSRTSSGIPPQEPSLPPQSLIRSLSSHQGTCAQHS